MLSRDWRQLGDATRRLIIAGAIAAVVCVAGWAILEPRNMLKDVEAKAECQYSYRPTDKDHRASQLSGVICTETPPHSHEDDAYDGRDYSRPLTVLAAVRHWLHKMIAEPVSFLTLVLAVSTFLLWMSTRRLWKGAEAQSEDFRRSVDAQMDANQAQVWVTAFTVGDIPTASDAPINLAYKTKIQNTGPTRALVTRLHGNFAVLELGEELPSSPDYAGESTDMVILLPARGIAESNDSVIPGVFSEDVNGLTTGDRQAYVYGFIEYIDAFSRTYRSGYAFALKFDVGGKCVGQYTAGTMAYWSHTRIDGS